MSKEKYTLKLTEVIIGYLKILHRIPSIILNGLSILKLKDNDNKSWGALIESTALKYPKNIALKWEDESLRYHELNRVINGYANYFSSEGIEKGDVVNVFLDNRPELLFIYSALAKIGAIPALLNPNSKGESLLHCAKLHSSNIIIVGEEVWESFSEVKEKISQKIYYISDKNMIDPKLPDLRDKVKDNRDINASRNDIKLGDPFAYVFTSGTTGGMPKAAIVIHKRLFSAMIWFGRVVQKTKSRDTIYCPLPFYHTNGITVGWPTAIANGAALAFRQKFSVNNFLDDVRKFNATIFIYIGELPRYLMNSTEKPDDKKNPLKKVIGNGLRPEIWKGFKKRFGISKVYEFYGAAESIWIFSNILNLNNTVGLNTQIYAVIKYNVETDEPVRGENGYCYRVEPGDTGLLVFGISDKFKFAGYTKKEATEKKILRNVFVNNDTWFNTGDLVRDIGYRHIQFVDRVGDTFRYKGENVSTTEVEKILNSCPGIISSNVYGVQIPNSSGRIGMAAITINDHTDVLNFDRVFSHLKSNLPHYAIPHFLRVQSSFATTNTYKKTKFNLKNEGFNPVVVDDPIYMLSPSESGYRELTIEKYNDIIDDKYKL